MPTTIAEIVTAITEAIGTFVPLASISLFAGFGAVVSAGIMLAKRSVKALR